MRILIATDSYKGSLSAKEACDAIRDGIILKNPKSNIAILPLADGGEGTVDAICDIQGTKPINAKTIDALMRPVLAKYCVMGDTAVMEMASAAGITLLKKDELNPKVTTTYGSGILLKDALDRGIKKIILGIGGSATNDAGAGALVALGAKLLDKDGKEVPLGGAALRLIHKIDLSSFDNRIFETEITVACDVDALLCGENGATKVFARQKGATEDDIPLLENALINFGKVLEKTYSKPVFNIAGGGAAGGLGAMLSVCCNAALCPGIELISTLVGLEEKIKKCDIVITGEGKTDSSTLLGKLPVGVAHLSKKHGKPCILLSGDIDCSHDLLYDAGFSQIHKARPTGASKEYSIANAKALLREKAATLVFNE
ncbi:MAG TPA: glycerate kinase [Clostridia bacterium]|nr:glycerate kinase [Clostridia bacterium]